MGEAFITRRGGSGLSTSSALVRVTAPAGSTITFSRGGIIIKTLRPNKGHIRSDDNTIADWYHSITSENFGNWVITATKSGETVNDMILIDSIEQYSIRLRYAFYFIKDGSLLLDSGYTLNHIGGAGTKHEEVTIDGVKYFELSSTTSSNNISTGYFTPKQPFPIPEGYDTFSITCKTTGNSASNCQFGLLSSYGNTTIQPTFYAGENICDLSTDPAVSVLTTHSIDCSEANSQYWFGLYAKRASGTTDARILIRDLFLTKSSVE